MIIILDFYISSHSSIFLRLTERMTERTIAPRPLGLRKNQRDRPAWQLAERYIPACNSRSDVPPPRKTWISWLRGVFGVSMRILYWVLLSSSFGWAVAFQVPALAVDAAQGGVELSERSGSQVELARVNSASPDLLCSPEDREDALSKFGCSCTTCVSTVQQLRGQAPLRQLLFGGGQNWPDSAHPHQVPGTTLEK